MRPYSWLRVALILAATFSLTACTFFASLFPDKQKQYRYTTELPDLEIPPDLTASKIDGRDEGPSARGKGRPDAREEGSTETESSAPRLSANRPGPKKAPPKRGGPNMTLAESSDNSALIEVGQPFAETWGDVSRALGRLKVEISDQNRSDGVFYVYYGGAPPKKAEATTLWDDLASVFSVDRDLAQEYRVKLEERDEFTNIRVLDQDDKAVSEGPGLDLLKRLHRKLLTLDEPETEGDEGKSDSETESK